MKLTRGQRLVVATHNPGKVAEINDLLRPFGLDAVAAGTLGLAEPVETETTFIGNARLKANFAMTATGMPALADDSGIEIDCLDGAPGVYSADWAGPSKNFALAMQKVADEITRRNGWTEPRPRANFACTLCLAVPGQEPRFFEGRVFGHLVWPPRGTKGFGYDPMFQPDGGALTFGEMESQFKHATSHRAIAFAQFVDACLRQP
jgi:XTP/dITP diphosphohydrolase